MAIETIERQRTEKRWFRLTNEEKTEVMRVIDEYEFIDMVLKYKSALMPNDLVGELTRQNDINRETIMKFMGKGPAYPIQLAQSA